MEEHNDLCNEEDVCLKLSPDVVITEDNALVHGIELNPDIKFNVKDTCDTREVRCDSGKYKGISEISEVCVPQGLEIIPIFKPNDKMPDYHFHYEQLGSLLENVQKNNFNKNRTLETLKLKTCSDLSIKRCSNSGTNLKKKLKSDNIEGEHSIKASNISAVSNIPVTKEDIPQMGMNNSVDVTPVLSQQHFLVTCEESQATTTEDKEVALTNLEMLIGQKSDYVHYCKICGVESESKMCITEHINSAHSSREGYELSISCPHCPYKNINKRKLENHVASHTTKKRFQCVECGFSTAAKALLMKHVTIHLEKDPFKCEICGYTSHELYRVRIHKESKHGVRKET